MLNEPDKELEARGLRFARYNSGARVQELIDLTVSDLRLEPQQL